MIDQPGIALLTPALVATLLQAAQIAADRAYVPYSRFPVGAAIMMENGEVHTGANIENASYGLTVCAERTAIFQAILAGQRIVRAVAVHAPKSTRVTPCGACRQVLNEFKAPGGDIVIILDGNDGPELTTLSHLLPEAFGPSNLENLT